MGLIQPAYFTFIIIAIIILVFFKTKQSFFYTTLAVVNILFLGLFEVHLGWVALIMGGLFVLVRGKPILKMTVAAVSIMTFVFFKTRGVFSSTDQMIWTNPTLALLPLGFSYVLFAGLALVPKANMGIADKIRSFSKVTLFTNIVSGPFLNTRDLEMLGPQSLSDEDVREACFLVVNGLFKKTLADLASVYFLNRMDMISGGAASSWIYLLTLSGFFYCDFSGYTDIACGLARFLGFKIKLNFYLPYLAQSISSFWGRWHISLGEWFREKVFNPGLSKVWKLFKRKRWNFPILANCVVLLGTVLLVGFWHGISIKFFCWALVTGLLLCFFPSYERFPLRWPLTLYLVFWLQSMVLLPDLSRVKDLFLSAHGFSVSSYLHTLLPTEIGFSVLLMVVPHFIDWLYLQRQLLDKSKLYYLTMLVQLTVFFFFSQAGIPFVYSNF